MARITKELPPLPYKRKRLTDDDPMPFGKHKGERMEDVPADYLLFIFEKGSCTAAVSEYCRNCYDVLKKQAKEIERRKNQ